MELMEHQVEAAEQLGNGKILWGGVGSGKSATVLAYYEKNESPRDIYVITTAKKRDKLEWEGEAVHFGIGTQSDATVHGVLTVDSWNNVEKYVDVRDAFFIFDEQRLVGHGTWVKSFFKIAKENHWVLLSATPGDTWLDYAPVFVANGFYKNITEFKRTHVLYEPFFHYPKVKGYLGETKLEILRNEILVEMPYLKHTERHMNFMDVGYDKEPYNRVLNDRWHIYEDRPITDAAEMFRLLRQIVNSHPSRLETLLELMKIHPKLIVFYNWNYELDILRLLGGSFFNDGSYEVAEWNGHRKQPIPKSDKWVYLVQYVSGAEGWNCTETDAMVLYSLTYSYKNFIQAMGRIDRLDTEFVDLYYYVFVSNSITDQGPRRALGTKKSFNERKFLRETPEFRGV